MSRKKIVRKCLGCSNPIPLGHSKWCSEKCRLDAKKLIKDIECFTCKTIFIQKNGARFCSVKCRKNNFAPIRKEKEFVYSLRKYNLGLKDYDELFEIQDGKCAICQSVETMLLHGKIKRLAIDHCHQTNVVRGLLCSRCNLAIGQFNDNWVLLENALEYLIAGDLKAGTTHRMGSRNDNA
jgi:predicted nucleic acid-binding Zn ribbon protein